MLLTGKANTASILENELFFLTLARSFLIARIVEKDYFDTGNFYIFLYRYRLSLVVIILASGITSAIGSFMIEEKFESKAVIYPSNTVSSRSLLSDKGLNKSIMEFGEEEKSEQLLEVLHSERIRSRIIAKFNLMDHYGIDTSETETPNHDLYEKYNDNISFTKNKNMAVEVEVWDHSPDTAALIANTILTELDEVMNEIQKKRAIQGYKIVSKAYFTLKDEITAIEDSLKKIMSYGILSIDAQSEVYSNSYAEAIRLGNKSGAEQLEEKLKVFSKYGGDFISLKNKLNNEMERLSELKAKYEEAKADAEEKLENFFVVTSAFPAEKKAYPIRWLIVSISVLSTTLLGLITLTVYEKLQVLRSNMASE